MSRAEIKEKLVSTINNIHDDRMLEEVYRFFQLEFEGQDIYTFNDAEREKVNRALDQVKNGKVLTEEKANLEIEKWLEEYPI